MPMALEPGLLPTVCALPVLPCPSPFIPMCGDLIGWACWGGVARIFGCLAMSFAVFWGLGLGFFIFFVI